MAQDTKAPHSYHAGVRIRIYDEDSNLIFGTGVSELLVRTDKLQSLHAAAGEMNMSYRKALALVHRAEEGLGHAILDKKIGGVGGGGSCLTPFGQKLVVRFLLTEKETSSHIEQNLLAHLEELLDEEG